jgi:hypothetical protein
MADPRFLNEFLAALDHPLNRRLVTTFRDLARSDAGASSASLRQEMDNIFEAIKDALPQPDGA